MARRYSLEAFAYSQLGPSDVSREKLRQAELQCPVPDPLLAADLSIRRGTLERSAIDSEKDYLTALSLARQEHDTYREAIALLNLGSATLNQERYDQSIDWNQDSLRISSTLGYKRIEEKAQGNLAFAHGKLGDFDQATNLYQQAEQSSRDLDAGDDRITWRNNLGMIHEQTGQLELAESDYNQALVIARQQGVKGWMTVILGELAFLSTRIGEWDQAKVFSGQAFDSALQNENRPVQLQAMLVQALIGSHNGDRKTAETLLSEVASDPGHDRQSLRWEAQAALANLYSQEHRVGAAQAEYQIALNTVRDARCSVNREDHRLSFFANASRVYNSYIDFLVENGKTAEALKTADESRALTLAEGLGVEGKKCLTAEAAFNPQGSARVAKATILFYWLGAEHSYLWAVAPDRIKIYPLPPAAKIEAAVEAYRKALLGSRDVLEAGDANGAMLYETLVAPAEEFFRSDQPNTGPRASLRQVSLQPAGGKQPATPHVIVIADSSLNGLNFETLIDRKPSPHYWIDDVTTENASSLRLLAAAAERHSPPGGKLLLIGNPMPPSEGGFAPLPNAAKEMQSVERSFPAASEEVYEQRGSTPQAYINGHPEQFAYIHFVAHGVASLSDPLDSAVVLSPDGSAAKGTVKDAAYKLYARDVMAHPLKADLVTVSTCKGAGVRAYTGEGLVGLSWAFLHAGAHHVIGALWDVSDESTPRLMAAMYAELVKGTPPDAALRTAKLSLLHSGAPFRKPYYWAPFQLYTGS